jgi:hypothetical protein
VVGAAERSGEEELVKLVESMALLGAAVDIPTRDDTGVRSLTIKLMMRCCSGGRHKSNQWLDTSKTSGYMNCLIASRIYSEN